MTILTAALFIVLSVFNGFESLIVDLFNSFDPDLKITASAAKSFDFETFPAEKLAHEKGVVHYTRVIEENALLKYGDKSYIATLKGVDSSYFHITRLEEMMRDGSPALTYQGRQMAVLGYGVASALAVNLGNVFRPIDLYVPKKTKKGVMITPENAFNIREVLPSGVFSIQQDFDSKYVIIPLNLARELTQYGTRLNAVEVAIDKDADVFEVQHRLEKLLGPAYRIQNRYEQHEVLYKIMKSEKWAIFLILTFTLIIGSFNVIGALTMLIVEKKKDIRTLWSMGADGRMIRRVFMTEGVMISLLGCSLGVVLGFAICWLQYRYGIVSLEGSGTFVVEAYPVEIHFRDMLSVFVTVTLIGIIAAAIPARRISRKTLQWRQTA